MEQSSCVRGHDGRLLTIADIPSPDTERWVIRRKAEVIAAVNGGLLSLEEACIRYALDTEEFKAWEASYKQHGLRRPQNHTITNLFDEHSWAKKDQTSSPASQSGEAIRKKYDAVAVARKNGSATFVGCGTDN